MGLPMSGNMTGFNDNEKTSELFFTIIRDRMTRCVFQPIISLRDGSIYGYEALGRGPKGTTLESPEALIRCAEQHNAMLELEYLFRFKALQAAIQIPQGIKLFLNVNPNIIQDTDFRTGFTKDHLTQFSICAEDIVFEITERESVKNLQNFKSIIEHYKAQKYKISIDDAGAGYSGLNLISDIQPHFIKLDMKLIRGIDKDLTKQALIRSMCEFASLTNTHIIAEGIETEEELSKLIEFDISYGQGYLIQRPNENVQPVSGKILDIVTTRNKIKNRFFGIKVHDFHVKNICRPSMVVRSDVPVAHVEEILRENKNLPGMCVVKDDVPVGVITRSRFYQQLSGLFGHSLFSGKSIEKVMDVDFLNVDYKTTIDIVSKKAVLRSPEKMYDFIVVSKDGMYHGIVTVGELLEKTIELEVANAKNLNPLSGLPGNTMIEVELERAVHLRAAQCVLYFDIDNFKAYNDFYGFENGDKVIKTLTRIIKKHTPQNQFIGHIGGDDFIILLDMHHAEELCRTAIREFDSIVPQFYNAADAERGYITVKNRKSVEETFPLMSISIVGVCSSVYHNIYDLAEEAGKLKKECKQKPGSNYMLDHRFSLNRALAVDHALFSREDNLMWKFDSELSAERMSGKELVEAF